MLAIGGQDQTVRQSQLRVIGPSTACPVSIGAGGLGFGQYSEMTKAWTSTLVGGSGTVTITTLSATRAVGTFTFTALPATTTDATGNRTISGSFDVPSDRPLNPSGCGIT